MLIKSLLFEVCMNRFRNGRTFIVLLLFNKCAGQYPYAPTWGERGTSVISDYRHKMLVGSFDGMICGGPPRAIHNLRNFHDDVIKWKHFPRYWPFCAGNSPVTDDFRLQRLVTRSFDVIFHFRLNKRLSKQLVIWEAIALIMTSL